eukprot:TRINITY_DN19316_c0_g1_i1.p1 TRINITY_DN19316_c0_g1~~TRINITY_DN19316_c0_g1_i1.p1  ORF type:complete len:339 (+),score=109.54 TRINITY_DN19316_c0_g1_i1:322-1338(+)
MCNERYPSAERVCDQFFPGLFPRTRQDFDALAEASPEMTTEELMLEQIGLWNITMLVREYGCALNTGAKLSTPLQWEVAGIQDLLPEYYRGYRKVATHLRDTWYSYYQGEMIVASPKYKMGGVIPQVMHLTEGGSRRFLITYLSCHPEFNVYPSIGERRYARDPLDFLLFSQLNYYHVLLNMYKWMFVQEGHSEPQDTVLMALINLELSGNGTVVPRMYAVQSDDRVREALELRFSGAGPAAETLAPEWFDRKELWKEEELEDHHIQKERDRVHVVRQQRAEFSTWKEQVDGLDDEFKAYLRQQQRELEEDRKSMTWQFKNWLHRNMGGYGPVTRDMV